jgi:hypothetical protein
MTQDDRVKRVLSSLLGEPRIEVAGVLLRALVAFLRTTGAPDGPWTWEQIEEWTRAALARSRETEEAAASRSRSSAPGRTPK